MFGICSFAQVHPAASKVCLELHQSPFEAEAEQTCGGEPVTQASDHSAPTLLSIPHEPRLYRSHGIHDILTPIDWLCPCMEGYGIHDILTLALTLDQDGQFFYQDALYPSASSAQGIQGSMILLKLRKRAASKNGWREEQPTTRMAAHLSHTCCNRLFCPHNGPSEPTAPQHSSALLMTAYDAGSHCIM